MECEYAGFKICCAAVDGDQDTPVDDKHIGIGLNKNDPSAQTLHHMPCRRRQHQLGDNKCSIKREYVPSEYEIKHREMATRIAESSTDMWTRRVMLINFTSLPSEIEGARYWLQKVKEHMTSELIPKVSS